MTILHTATIDGQLVYRTSAARSYSHVVVAKPSYEVALADAERAGKGYQVAKNFEYYVAQLSGTAWNAGKNSWETEAQHAARLVYEANRAKEVLGGAETLEAFREKLRSDAVARVEAHKAAGKYDTWIDLGWSSRLDLATKLLNSEGSHSRYSAAKVLEATRQTFPNASQAKKALVQLQAAA